jgi:hypothetical protein
MKSIGSKVCCWVAALTLATPLYVLSADGGGVVYQPPKRGAPGGRVGGGTRGIQRDVFVLSVLAPDHSGLTISEQPILETRLPAPVQAGVHRVRLADHNIRLKPGAAYQWSVTVIPDSDRRSKDILAGGTIERVDVPDDLKAKLTTANKSELLSLYAEAGFWYDAVAAISEMIEAAPQDQALRKQRATLLSQVGLTGISE